MNFYGTRSKASDRLSSYISNRQQRVEKSESTSSGKLNVCGVPRLNFRSSVVPYLYKRSSNSCKNTEVFHFADDTNLSALGCAASEV